MKREKKCKYCSDKFMPYNSLQKCCFKSECIRAFNAEQADKKWNKKKKAIKEKNKSLTDYKRGLQTIINKIVSILDQGHACISCGGTTTEAGHYFSRGSSVGLDFNLHNIWMQCKKCNRFDGGNITGYDDGLINIYGREYWEYIKFDMRRLNSDVMLSIDLIKEAQPKANKVLRELKKNDRKFTNEQRKECRIMLNELIGIYKQ